jgi:hypothetical protein
MSIETFLISLLPSGLAQRVNKSRLRTHARAWSGAVNAPACTCGDTAWAPSGETQIVGGQRLRRKYGTTSVETMEIEEATCTNCGAVATMGREVGDDGEDAGEEQTPWQFL